MIEIPFLFIWRDLKRGTRGEFQYPSAVMSFGKLGKADHYLRLLLPKRRRVYNTQMMRWEHQWARLMWTSTDGWFICPRQYPMSRKNVMRANAGS